MLELADMLFHVHGCGDYDRSDVAIYELRYVFKEIVVLKL